MFEISRERVFSASHQLRGYEGRCERLHGHNWKVRVHLASQNLDERGMVIDFHDLDEMMTKALEPFEHRHITEVPPFDELNPSAENLALIIGQSVTKQLMNTGVKVVCCDVWENDLSRARYIVDGD